MIIYKFQNSVNDLIKQLSTKQPFYIRCIKPNELRLSTIFDWKTVQHQVH